MKREQKTQVVEELTSTLGEADAIFAVDYRGISVGQAAELRGKLREADALFQVVKNRLAKRATAGAVAEAIDEHLVGPTALTLVRGDAVIAAKAISTFARENDVLEFKGGLMDGEVLDPEGFAAIARLPGLDVLRGQLVGVAASPITGLARGLGSMVSGLAIALGQIADQGLVSGEPPTEQPEPEAPEPPSRASDEVAEAAAEPAAPSEPEPADTGAEGEDAGGETEVAEREPEPAAPSEPEPDGTGGEAEDSGGESVAEPEPADTGAEGEDAGGETEVAEAGAEPAEPEPTDTGGEAEDVGADTDKEA